MEARCSCGSGSCLPPLAVRERHDPTALDTGRDGRVTTQSTTQNVGPTFTGTLTKRVKYPRPSETRPMSVAMRMQPFNPFGIEGIAETQIVSSAHYLCKIQCAWEGWERDRLDSSIRNSV